MHKFDTVEEQNEFDKNKFLKIAFMAKLDLHDTTINLNELFEFIRNQVELKDGRWKIVW